jgi:hypothetical protein
MLVAFAAEDLDDLSSARGLAVHATGLDPVTCAGFGFNGLGGHPITSFDAIKPLGHELAIGDGAKRRYGDLRLCAPGHAGSRSGNEWRSL